MELVHRQWLDSDGLGGNGIRGLAWRNGGIAGGVVIYELRVTIFDLKPVGAK